MVNEWDLPHLRTAFRLGGPKENSAIQIYGVKFYPYQGDTDPFFAVTGHSETIICRPPQSKEKGVEIIRWFRDDDPDASLNSCAWSQDLKTGNPLVCVAGKSSKVKILDVKTGKIHRTLVGHGKEINDLAVSTANPQILASASGDRSIRLWTLDPAYEHQPCAVICAGEGHSESVLTVAFHHSGRYLLSGGMDHHVNLWVLPELPNASTGTDKPVLLHYPHFSTSAIHHDFVDCVAFHDDLILSKASREGCIILWKITGFSSSKTPPASREAPTTHELQETRSAFGDGFERLLQFDTPGTDWFYMRFGLFNQPFKHPVLVMANDNSKISFWDLQRLEEYEEGEEPWLAKRVKKSGSSLLRVDSPASTASSGTGKGSKENRSSIPRGPVIDLVRSKKYDVSDPFKNLEAHQSVTVPKVKFTGRQAAWSPGGEWCVVVGDHGMVAVLGRWGRSG